MNSTMSTGSMDKELRCVDTSRSESFSDKDLAIAAIMKTSAMTVTTQYVDDELGDLEASASDSLSVGEHSIAAFRRKLREEKQQEAEQEESKSFLSTRAVVFCFCIAVIIVAVSTGIGTAVTRASSSTSMAADVVPGPSPSPTESPSAEPISPSFSPSLRPTSQAPSFEPTSKPTEKPLDGPTFSGTPATGNQCYSDSASNDLYNSMCELYCDNLDVNARTLPEIKATKEILFIDLTLETSSGTCWNAKLREMETSYTIESAQRIVFLADISDIDWKCKLEYKWQYSYLRGAGTVILDLTGNSASATWVSESPDFDLQPPENVFADSCTANASVTSVQFSGNIAQQVSTVFTEMMRENVEDKVSATICEEMSSTGSQSVRTSQQSCY